MTQLPTYWYRTEYFWIGELQCLVLRIRGTLLQDTPTGT